jgi:pyruvate kinase
MSWGVDALKIAEYTSTLSTMTTAEQMAFEGGMVAEGDLLVFIGGLGAPSAGQTNVLTVQLAGATGRPS